jgi:acyl dehydratase
MAESLLDIPAEKRFFEDYTEGAMYEFGSVTVKEEEIIEFARQYDPQPFHTNPDIAQTTGFGGIVASGWHTAGMAMKLLVENYLPGRSALGSPGVDQLRWHKPVRPGDILSVRVTIIETKQSRSKPDRGLLRTFVEVMTSNERLLQAGGG